MDLDETRPIGTPVGRVPCRTNNGIHHYVILKGPTMLEIIVKIVEILEALLPL